MLLLCFDIFSLSFVLFFISPAVFLHLPSKTLCLSIYYLFCLKHSFHHPELLSPKPVSSVFGCRKQRLNVLTWKLLQPRVKIALKLKPKNSGLWHVMQSQACLPLWAQECFWWALFVVETDMIKVGRIKTIYQNNSQGCIWPPQTEPWTWSLPLGTDKPADRSWEGESSLSKADEGTRERDKSP